MRKNRYVSVTRGRSRRRRNGWKIAFVAALAVAVALVVVLLSSREPQPFSTVTPATSPIQITDPTQPVYEEEPEVTPAGALEEEPDGVEETPAVEAKNPVETLLSAYAEEYEASRAVSEPLFSKYALKLMSFDMATSLCHSRLTEIAQVFSGLEQGESVGSWESVDASVEASEGNYAIEAEYEDGSVLTGAVSSTMTRMRFEIKDGEGALLESYEVVKGSDGYFVQCYRPDGAYPNIRYMTGAFGLSCAIDAQQQAALYDAVPVSWNAAAEGSQEAMRATEGGAVVNIAGTETLCDK